MSEDHIMEANERTFKDYINKQGAVALNVEWVIWMLEFLSRANQMKVKINLAYLTASHTTSKDDPEPRMIYV